MRIIVTGASGQLGTYILDELTALRAVHQIQAWTSSRHLAGNSNGLVPVNLCDLAATKAVLELFQPDVILHLAAVSKPAQVLGDRDYAWNVNVRGTESLVEWCRKTHCRLVFTSTDMVFDGTHAPYREDAQPSPSNEYGRTKAVAESLVLSIPQGMVVRVPLLYGPTRCDRPSFYDQSLNALRGGESQFFFEDEYRTPLDLLTAARLLIGLSDCQAAGIVHLGGPERLSRLQLMRRVAARLGINQSLIAGNRLSDQVGPEPRPADTAMVSDRIAVLVPNVLRPPIETAITQMLD